jgi:hypothetical protein
VRIAVFGAERIGGALLKLPRDAQRGSKRDADDTILLKLMNGLAVMLDLG